MIQTTFRAAQANQPNYAKAPELLKMNVQSKKEKSSTVKFTPQPRFVANRRFSFDGAEGGYEGL